jgi:tetratricopeptide (TPR) repeat protein
MKPLQLSSSNTNSLLNPPIQRRPMRLLVGFCLFVMIVVPFPTRGQEQEAQSLADAARAARSKHAQQTSRDTALAAKPPLSDTQLLAWRIAGVPTLDTLNELKSRGIAFPPDDAHLNLLKDAGLPAELLAALPAIPVHSETAGSPAIPQPLVAASQAFRAKDYLTARHILESLVLQNQSADLYAALGNLHFLSNDLPSAKTAFERAAQLNPSFVYAHVRLARIHYRLEEGPQAAAEARKALKLEPANAEARKYLALSFAMEGQGSTIEASSASSSGGDVEDLSDLKVGDNAEARDLIKQGSEFMKKHDYGKAEAAFRRAIQLDPNVAAYHYDMGLMYTKWPWPEKALTAYEEAKALAPRNLAVRQNVGYTLCHMGRWSEAVVEFRELLRMEPTWNMARPCLIEALDHLGRKKEADEVSKDYQRFKTTGDDDDNLQIHPI